MASSDVIELGSSEDEAEPVPKKKKPKPNAMVHFPNEVPGLVIKPLKPDVPNLQKVIAGGAITITNVKKAKGPIQAIKVKSIGRPGQMPVQQAPMKPIMIKHASSLNPMAAHRLTVNPLSLMKKTPNLKVQPPKVSLPPGITIKRTAAYQNNVNQRNMLVGKGKANFKRKHPGKVITTVELDDEEAPITSGTSPQWYLRPEEQSNSEVETKKCETKDKQENSDLDKNENMELENNKEPDTRNYIEITIEDSPIKPIQVRKGFEVGTELPITIEDSPVKLIKSVKDQTCASDSEAENPNDPEPQSKKRLDYPKSKEDSGKSVEQNTVEIDLETDPSVDKSKEKNVEVAVVDGEKIMESDSKEVNMPKRIQTVLVTKEIKDDEKSSQPNTADKSDSSEFHPTYQKFIDLCFELENSDDMAKIVEKKIKTYYRQCPKDYVESEEFTDMVSSKIFAMKAAPDKMYLYIKDIVDELNLQRKSAKTIEVSNKENENKEEKYVLADDGEYDTKRRRQIRKLDKTIKKLHRAIQKLEEQEVEFDDEEDSVYLLTERYKERLIKVHAKFCQLSNTKMPSEPRIQIESRPGYPTGPAKRLEKWVNKKVPIGAPLPFPDFHDVLRCVREANEEDRLGWNEADIMEEARDLFVRCGKKLQRRRQENEWRIAASRISHDASPTDPAEKSDDLKKKLEDNKTVAAKKEIELLNKYADKQNLLKLVGEEIGDKEAEESPVESEDEEGNDESNSLGDKQKRKERLKRLLHEKTKKSLSEKENNTTEANVDVTENIAVQAEEEKLESADVSDKTENKSEDLQESVKEAETKETSTNNIIIDISEDVCQKEQKKEKSNDSDMYDVDSDIDELHLLQKLYSENEINSSTQESDSDTPIAISDTLESESDNGDVKIQQGEDIISIENSSYSESEGDKKESENARASEDKREEHAESVKNKKIDGLLLQNAEVSLHSTKDTMDIDEENILLASSEEDNDFDTNMNADNTQDSTCGLKSSNNDSANNDCEVILDNCDDDSMEKDVKMYEDSQSKEDIENINKNIIEINSEDDKLDNNQVYMECDEITSEQGNTQVENIVEVDSESTSASVEENQELVNNSCKTSDGFCENDTKTKIKIQSEDKNSKCSESNSLNNQSCMDNDELNTISDKEINNSENKLCVDSKIEGNGNNEDTINYSISASPDSNECEIMGVNVEIASDNNSSLTNQQNTCKDVEVASVECK